MLKKWIITLLSILLLSLAACGGNEDEESSDSENSDVGNSQVDIAESADDATFTLEFSTGAVVTQDDGNASEGNRPAEADPFAMMEFRSGGTVSGTFVRIEFENDALSVGEEPVDRASISATTTLDGDEVRISCDLDGDATSTTVNITALDANRASGAFTLTGTGCTNYMTGQPTSVESLTVIGTFENVPFRPE